MLIKFLSYLFNSGKICNNLNLVSKALDTERYFLGSKNFTHLFKDYKLE